MANKFRELVTQRLASKKTTAIIDAALIQGGDLGNLNRVFNDIDSAVIPPEIEAQLVHFTSKIRQIFPARFLAGLEQEEKIKQADEMLKPILLQDAIINYAKSTEEPGYYGPDLFEGFDTWRHGISQMVKNHFIDPQTNQLHPWIIEALGEANYNELLKKYTPQQINTALVSSFDYIIGEHLLINTLKNLNQKNNLDYAIDNYAASLANRVVDDKHFALKASWRELNSAIQLATSSKDKAVVAEILGAPDETPASATLWSSNEKIHQTWQNLQKRNHIELIPLSKQCKELENNLNKKIASLASAEPKILKPARRFFDWAKTLFNTISPKPLPLSTIGTLETILTKVHKVNVHLGSSSFSHILQREIDGDRAKFERLQHEEPISEPEFQPNPLQTEANPAAIAKVEANLSASPAPDIDEEEPTAGLGLASTH